MTVLWILAELVLAAASLWAVMSILAWPDSPARIISGRKIRK